MAKKESLGNNDVPTIELNIKDLPDLPAKMPMSAADIEKRVAKANGKNKPTVKKNGDGTTSVINGNVEVELQKDATPEDIAATAALITATAAVEEIQEEEAKPKKAKKAKEPKPPKEPAPPRARKWGRIPSASIKKMDISEMRANVTALPEAQRRRLLYEYEDESGRMRTQEVKDFIGVDMQGIIVNVPSKDYEIVQYAEAFSPVLDFLAEHHETSTICGGLTNNKLQAHMYVAFPEKYNYVDPTGKKFELGMIVSAGHKDRAVRFDGFGFRGFCMNQYYLSQSLGSMAAVHRSNAHDKIANYVNQLGFGIESLDEHMKLSRSIGLPAEEVEAWVKCNYLDRAAGPIVKRYQDDGEANLLGLYNAITNVMTRQGEQGLLDANGLMDNLKWAEDLIRVDDGQQEIVIEEFAEAPANWQKMLAEMPAPKVVA